MDQTIDLDTGQLNTTEFAPDFVKSATPIANAREKVKHYFRTAAR